MNIIAYVVSQLLMVLLFPLVLLATLRDAKKRKGGKRFICQRFGFAYPGCDQTPIWFHAASLGEVNAIEPLVYLIKDKDPAATILITTATPAGANAVKKLNVPGVIHAYQPIDYPWAVQHFLNSYKPSHLVVVETELWPNLLALSKRAGCSPTIINGRLSHKSTDKKWLYPLYNFCLSQCTMIYTRSNKDHSNFLQLGAQKQQLLTVGNIKFAGDILDASNYPQLIDRPYLLAASTHEDEEWQFCHALAATGKLLVIVPRHPERRDDILKSISRLPLNIAMRSKGDDVTTETQVYIADTMGEMMAFMAHAELVFMGGSLIPHGGQNMLEAARLGKAIISGPHTHNFVDEVSALKDIGAMTEVADADMLRLTTNELIEQPADIQEMGNHAQELMKNNGGIAKQYYRLLIKQWGH